MVSRTWSSAQIQATTRSMPMPKPAWGTRAISAQVEIPLEGFHRQLVLLDAALQQLVARHALRAADDFAVALGRQHVDAEREVRVLRVGLHVEGLHRGRVAMHHDRAVELRAEPGLVGRAEVVAVLEGLLEFALLVRLVEHRRPLRRSAGAGTAAGWSSSFSGSRPMTCSSGARFFSTLCTMCERKFSASSIRPSRSSRRLRARSSRTR